MDSVNLNEQAINTKDDLINLVTALDPMKVTLEQNSYVKDTTKKLARLIDDASSNAIVLVIGKERVGKTTIINSLLGREILPTSQKYPTSINTFIKYSENQEIRAYFLDGMVASFDMSKIELFTTSDSFIAEIIRDHIDYLEIYLDIDVLKKVTIVDSVALELTGSESAFVSDLLVNRADEILWVLRGHTGLTPPELSLLEKFINRGISPHIIVNAIDELTNNRHEIIKALRDQLSPFVQSFSAISARLAIEAKKTNNTQVLIDSQFVELQQLFNQLTINKEAKLNRVIERLIEWLDNFYIEIKYLLMREPLLSAKLQLQSVSGEEGFEFSRTQRDIAIISAYKDEYKNAAQVFKDVQTLYQLLSLLTKEIHLRNASVENFEEVAANYQKNVREYRKKHVDYMQSYGVLDSKIRKNIGISIDKIDINKHATQEVMDLLKKHKELVKLWETIEELKVQVVNLLPGIVLQLNDLAKEKLVAIFNKTQEVNLYRKVEVQHLHSYNKKVEEFECVEEAQRLLLENIKPQLLNEALPIDPKKRNELEMLFDKISKVQLGIRALQVELPSHEEDKDESIDITFQEDHPFTPLSLVEADVVSDIPDLPNMIGNQ